MNTLQNAQQPAYSSGLPAQSYGSPYGYQSPYGGYPFYQQPQMYQPPMPMYPPPQPQYPNFGGNMNYGYPPVGGAVYQPPASVSQLLRFFQIFFHSFYTLQTGGASGKPDYEMSGDFTTGSVPSNTPGVVVDVDNPNSGLNWQGNSGSGGLDWQGNNGGLNWQGNQPGLSFGPPNWQQSFTPISNGCYNRCRPSCSFRPRPVPLPMPMPPRPRPRPIPLPMPRPQPMPKPNYGCRSVCRPMCNQVPTCGGGSQFNGNTMVCGNKPNYGGMYGGNYGYGYGYGAQMQQQFAQQPVAQVAQEEPEADAEEDN